MFQFIKVLVRQLYQIAFLIAILRVNGHAEIERYCDAKLQRLQFALILRAHATGKGGGLFGIRLRKEQSKLVPADAECKIGCAQSSLEGGGGETQNLIALKMPIAIIHFLELMKIENHDRQVLAIPFCAIQFLIAILVEEAPVVESGQRIRCGVDLQFLEDRRTP